MTSSDYRENGIVIITERGQADANDAFYNPRGRVYRELAFCSLCHLVSTKKATNGEEKLLVTALDPFTASGINGFFWKQRLKHEVSVNMSDSSLSAVECAKFNASLNKISVTSTSTPSNNEKTSCATNETTVDLQLKDANVVLHSTPSDFVLIDPFGSCAGFLDATFRHVRKNGIVLLVGTDITALRAKCPDVTMRLYGVKTSRLIDFREEFAARVLLSSALRSAARCKKGLHPLFCATTEHYTVVAVRVRRGPSHADSCLQQILPLAHCVVCQERAFCPPSVEICPSSDDLRHLLKCDCHKTSGSSTQFLGPLWSGPLFDVSFLRSIYKIAKVENLPLCQPLIASMLEEALCLTADEDKCLVECKHNAEISHEQPPIKKLRTEAIEVKFIPVSEADDNSNDLKKVNSLSENKEASTNRIVDPGLLKLLNSDNNFHNGSGMPPFFYIIGRAGDFKSCSLPKLTKLVGFIRSKGYRASRSHFHSHAIRTNCPWVTLCDLIRSKFTQ